MAPAPRKLSVVNSASVAHPSEEASEQHERSTGMGSFGQLSPLNAALSHISMAKGGGGGDMGSSSMSATRTRTPLQFAMPGPPVTQGPKLDDGGSGGDIGKIIHNGGGGGGDDDDDDDTFGEGEDGDGDGEGGDKQDSYFRTIIPEAYDTFSVGAVLQEWFRTVADLPLIMRRAVEMGLFSSAQLVRFFSMDVRPGMARSVSRALPPAWAREFVGRLMGDPAFLHKMAFESALSGGLSMWHESTVRGPRFRDELDLAIINSMGMMFATAATSWALTPTRSYGSVHKFAWQQKLDSLPNCVFDASGPLREYSLASRAGALLAKGAELSAIGWFAGAATSLMTSAAVSLHQRSNPSYQPSVEAPGLGSSAAGLAGFFALNANARYQLIGGMDRYLFSHSNYLWTYVGVSGVARIISQNIGEMARPFMQGLATTPAPIVKVEKNRRMVKRVKPRVAPVAAAAAIDAPTSGSDDSTAVMAGASAVAGAAAVASSQEQQQQSPSAVSRPAATAADFEARAFAPSASAESIGGSSSARSEPPHTSSHSSTSQPSIESAAPQQPHALTSSDSRVDGISEGGEAKASQLKQQIPEQFGSAL
ncbi:MAG: hypothetical protein WDW38_000873 [Sanguina aurantia]